MQMPRSNGMTQTIFRVLVTGAQGFIGKNLVLRLREQGNFEVLTFARGDEHAAVFYKRHVGGV